MSTSPPQALARRIEPHVNRGTIHAGEHTLAIAWLPHPWEHCRHSGAYGDLVPRLGPNGGVAADVERCGQCGASVGPFTASQPLGPDQELAPLLDSLVAIVAKLVAAACYTQRDTLRVRLERDLVECMLGMPANEDMQAWEAWAERFEVQIDSGEPGLEVTLDGEHGWRLAAWDMDPTDPTFASGEYREDEDDPFAVIVVEAPLPQTAMAWLATHVG